MKALTITRRVFSALAIAMVAGLALPAAAQTTQFTATRDDSHFGRRK